MTLINQMTGDQMLDESLTGADLKDGTVEGSTANVAGTQKDIKQGTISTPDLRDGAVTAAKAFTGSVEGTLCAGNDSRIPTQDENDALMGTYGSPSNTNRYVVNNDPRVLPLWTAGTAYTEGQLVIYNALLYRCVTSNSDTTFTASKWHCLGNIMTGASAVAAGTRGLVPTPAAGDDIKALYGDGTFKLPTVLYDTGQYRTAIGVDTQWYEFAQFIWAGSSVIGTPTTFQIVINCAAAGVKYYCKVLNLSDGTTFIPQTTVVSTSVIGNNANTISNFAVTPSTGPKVMSIQIAAASGAKKNVKLTGSLLKIN